MAYINIIKQDYLTENDIDQVLEIQKLVYNKDLLESKETFLSMINNYPSGCLCLRDENKLLGYFITHPENINNLPPSLNLNIHSNNENNIYYFHDLAVHPSARNLRIGSTLIFLAVKIAIINKFDKIALTAVQNADKFWNKFGFIPITIEKKTSLLSYGPDAVVMISSISTILNRLYNLGFPSLVYVYIIKLKNNKYYVKKSNILTLDSLEFNNIEWLYYNPIINLKESKIRIFENDINEDTIVLELMQIYGVNHVRGGTFQTLNISIDNAYDILCEIKIENNKCYLCGENHSINKCKLKNKYDYNNLVYFLELATTFN